MATVDKISIALPPDMISMIRTAVSSGEYASTSEVIREALRAWKFRRKVETAEIEELRELVKQGINSGPAVDGEELFARLTKKYKDLPEHD